MFSGLILLVSRQCNVDLVVFLWLPLFDSTCNPVEQNDPDCSEHPGSADAEPREEARPPRSPRRAHPASSPALRSEHAGDSDSSKRSLRSHQTLLLLLIYRLDAILTSGLHSRSPEAGASASGVRAASTPDIPDSSSLQARISSRGHRDDAHRSGAPSPPSCAAPPPRCERVFFWSLTEDHQGAPSAGWGVRSQGDPGWCISNITESLGDSNTATFIGSLRK